MADTSHTPLAAKQNPKELLEVERREVLLSPLLARQSMEEVRYNYFMAAM